MLCTENSRRQEAIYDMVEIFLHVHTYTSTTAIFVLEESLHPDETLEKNLETHACSWEGVVGERVMKRVRRLGALVGTGLIYPRSAKTRGSNM